MKPPVNKNDLIKIDIQSIGEGGEGIGRIDGYAVFVQGAIPGDSVQAKIIKVKNTYAVGRLEEVVNPSNARVKPPCPYAEKCGGCQIQHVDYQTQLEYKKEFVESAMVRIGKVNTPVENVMGMDEPFRYRNKGQYPVGGTTGDLKIGFYRPRSHDVVDIDHCLLQSETADAVIEALREAIPRMGWSVYDEKTHKGLLRNILVRTASQTGDMMLVFIVNGKKLPGLKALADELHVALPQLRSVVLNMNTSRGNTVMGRENLTVWGEDKITDYIGDLSFEISPLSFFQVNPLQTAKLYDKALEYAGLTGNETVFDIYCGIGTISLFLAQKAKRVIGVEIVEDAIKDARANAERNGINNSEFHAGPAEKVIPDLYDKGYRADVVVVDPPRKGCDEVVLQTILNMEPKRIVYVSCKPSTLARDLAILEAGGYRTEKIQPVDMFPHTGHVETVVKLQRRNP